MHDGHEQRLDAPAVLVELTGPLPQLRKRLLYRVFGGCHVSYDSIARASARFSSF